MTPSFDESQHRRSAVTGKFENKPQAGFAGELLDEPSGLGSAPDPVHADRIEREAQGRVAAMTEDERHAMAADPGTHPRTLTRLYLHAAAAGHPLLHDALARNEHTPAEVKSAILRRADEVDPDTRRHLMRTLRSIDFETGYEPYTDTHRGVRDQVVNQTPALGSAFSTASYVRSGLLHADDVKQALRGEDPDLRDRLDSIDWPRQYPNLTNEVVEEALEAGLPITANPRLTAQMQQQCVSHDPLAAEAVAGHPNADGKVLAALARDIRPSYARAADAAMNRLVTGRPY